MPGPKTARKRPADNRKELLTGTVTEEEALISRYANDSHSSRCLRSRQPRTRFPPMHLGGARWDLHDSGPSMSKSRRPSPTRPASARIAARDGPRPSTSPRRVRSRSIGPSCAEAIRCRPVRCVQNRSRLHARLRRVPEEPRPGTRDRGLPARFERRRDEAKSRGRLRSIDALSPLLITHIDMPGTPEKVWRAIRAAHRT